MVFDPDAQVQQTVRLLFETFWRTGSASAAVKHFRQEGLLFPSQVAGGPRKGEIAWVPLSISRTASVLHNPWYAGAYAYGRRRYRKRPDGGFRQEIVPRSEWHALIKDAHPGYITWEDHERIAQRLQEGREALGFGRRKSPPREGSALLQGRAVCGLCGSRMHVHYNVRRNGLAVPCYVCFGRGKEFRDPWCQSVVGTSIDEAVGKLLVEAMTPLALNLALAVHQEIADRLDEADRLRHRQVERAQYEADQARHRYMQVDPANRLVADTLEADWNAKLRALSAAQEDYQRHYAADRLAVDADARKRIEALATDFPAVWNDPATPHRERKRMLGLLIEDVTLVKQHEVTASVRFRGGATTTLTLPRPLTAFQLRATVLRQLDALLDEFDDAQVAQVLNERGHNTGAGDAFDAVSVQWVRFSHKLKSLKERLLDAGWLTGKQAEAKFAVGRTTLQRWRKTGRIRARICRAGGEWLYWPEIDKSGDDYDHVPVAEGTSTAKGAI